MKKIVSLLVAIAMVMSLSVTVFAADTSGSFMVADKVNYDWTAPATGVATFSTSSGTGMIAVNEGNLAMGTGSVTINCVEGTTYQIKHFIAGGDQISWTLEVNGGADADATSGTVAIESYGSGDFTAPKDGTIKLTIDSAVDGLDIVIGWAFYDSIANGGTFAAEAGTTYSIYPLNLTVDATLTWEYVEGGDDSGDSDEPVEFVPSGSALALGDNNVELTYATMPMAAPSWTFTATEGGYLSVTVDSINGDSNLGMAFGRGIYTLLVGETNGMGTNTATVYLAAGETTNIAVLDTMDLEPVPAVLNLTFMAGEPTVEKNPADFFEQNSDGQYIIPSLAEDVEIFVGNDDIYYIYTAEEAGVVTVTPADGLEGFTSSNCAIQVNGGSWDWSASPTAVKAGDVVVINIWSGYEGVVSFAAGEPEGGDQPGGDIEFVPAGDALVLGDNNVELTYATMPMAAPYWTYTATEGGYLTVTVDSINGDSNLGMAFGRGIYTLLVGETNGMGTNTVTVYLAAGETTNIAVLDTMDMEPVPAVLNLTFAAGEPVVEKNPADFFEQNSDGQYIIPSLAEDVEIFVGNDDIYYIYTAEEAGVVTVTPADGLEGFTSSNCAIQVNGGSWDWSASPTAVKAGDVVVINIWYGYEGVVSFEAGAGDAEDDETMSGTDVSVDANGSIEFFYTPDADGVLTITLSADPGYKVWVYENATDATVGLAKSGTSGTYTYDLKAGVEYRVVIIGYYDWSEAAATISYEATFAASELEVVKEELAETSVELVVGEQNVELLPNAITTLFNFYAPEAGVYTITLPEGVTAALYSVAWTAYQTAEGNTLVFTAAAEGQGFLVGLTSEEASFNVSVEKTGTYTPPAATTYLPYEPTTPVDADFQMPEGDVTNVDISEAHTAVLGDDGFYHLDTVDGPILYVNLNSNGFTLATLLDAGAPITMRGEKFQDENGDLFCYDYMNMIAFGDYYSYSQECDYYPLNADLMAFFQDYGAAQGWYNANFSNFEAIKSGEFNEESAWMVALVYIADDSGNQGGNQGGNTGDNPQTSDIGIIAASVTMTLSAIVGTALLCKKKEN